MSAAPAAELWLVRHGETEWNAQSRIQGHIDIALSARGRRQAQALARFLRGTPVDAVYASDLARARDTALPLAVELGRELRIDPRLRERGFGLFEGSTYAEAQASWPHEYAIWQRREPGHALPGGESYLQARERVLACLDEIVHRHAGAADAPPRIVVVTHGGVLDIVYRHALAIPWETPRSHLLPNASINRVAVHRGSGAAAARLEYAVLAWAEAGHLDGTRDEPV